MPGRTLVVDACLVITFGGTGQLDLVSGGDHRVVIGKRASAEVIHAPARPQLDAALENGSIDLESVDLDREAEQEALARYDSFVAFRNRGDAEVIALAATRGYIVGSDDAAVRRRVRADLGPERIAGTLDVVVWAIRDGRLSLAGADAFLTKCDVGPHLLRTMEASGTSLEDLI